MLALTAARRVLDGFRPNRRVPVPAVALYAAVSAATFLFAWQVSASSLPRPAEVWAALATLWHDKGLFDHLATSVALNAEAIAWAAGLTFALAYLTVLPAARPLVAALSKLRFTGMVGWAFVFTLYAENGHQLKLWMLVFGTTPFFLTAMAAVVADIPKERFDHARTLKLGEWRVVWEVVIRGTLDQALEALRQSAAMGWMMLTMVEGVVRSEGGIGALMLNENKHLDLASVFALIGVVLLVGVVQDLALGWLRRAACPYADLGCERRSS